MVIACVTFAWTPLLGAGDIIAFGIICIIAGACVGADIVLPPAMQADVVDYDALRNGRRRAGLFFALWGMATKLALAVAVGLAFPLLSLAGFSPNGPNAPFALDALAFAYGGAPVLLKLGVIALVWNFPITERRQRLIRRRLERRDQPGGGPQRSQT
jgi:Na+/melibiose symporter-like transporter